MKAAVLCPGPSLTTTWPAANQGEYDVVLGVNRAASFAACHWWVALDKISFEMCEPVGHPFILTGGRVVEDVKAKVGEGWVVKGADFAKRELRTKYHHYSGICAIAYAAHLGVKQVDVYGADWTDAGDFDGYRHPKQKRTERRWAREVRLYNSLLKELSQWRCRVERVQICHSSSSKS